MEAAAKASKIISRIREDSENEAQEILKSAKSKSDEILAKARTKALGLEEETVMRGKRDSELVKQRIIANAKLKAKKHRLDVKEKIIQAAFDEAEKRLAKITSSKDYPEVLRSIIREGAESIGTRDVEVLLRKEDVKIADDAFLGHLQKTLGVNVVLARKNIETFGGAVIRSKDGKIEINNTFESKMRRMRDELRSSIAKILFEE